MSETVFDGQLGRDAGLQGNEKLEEQIAMLQKEPSQEMLAVVLTTLRRRMREGGQMIVGVEAQAGAGLQVQAMQLGDGGKWIPVYTGFEEEMKGGNGVMSTYMADIRQLFMMVLADKNVRGLILNPWNLTLQLDKTLIQLILGGKEQ